MTHVNGRRYRMQQNGVLLLLQDDEYVAMYLCL